MDKFKLPYFVERTFVGKNLPIYTEYKSGGNKVITVIRKIFGSIDEFKKDIQSHDPHFKIEKRDDLQQLKIEGNKCKEIRKFLLRKGF